MTKISKVNEVYMHVDTEDGIARELWQFFTFEVPNAKFMPSYRSRQWDGKIRLFDLRDNKLYCGLLPYLEKYLKENNYQYELDKQLEEKDQITNDELYEFIKSLKLKYEIRDYQFDAVKHAIKNRRALFLSPTASGKSLIIYCIIVYYLLKDCRALILVPTTSLVEQMYKDFIDYGCNKKIIQRIYSGHTKDINSLITISTWQSIYKLNKDWFSQFDIVIGDEAHLFKAKSLTTILTNMVDCVYRFGLTGTLDGSETNKLVLEGLFGSVKKVTTTKELMDNNTVAKLSINCIVLKYDSVACKEIKGKNYQQEIEYIVENQKRNLFILNLAKHLKGNTLILFQLVEKHGKPLHELAEKTIENKDYVYFVYGGVKTQVREEIRSIVENSNNSIIIASYGTFSTGINIKNLHNVIFASPSKSKIRVLQSIGRGLRTSESKTDAVLYDIADDISCKGKPNFTLNHFVKRIEYYNVEQFDYKIDTVNI